MKSSGRTYSLIATEDYLPGTATEDYLPRAVRSIDVGCGRLILEFISQSRE
jgi:hypothetical protein